MHKSVLLKTLVFILRTLQLFNEYVCQTCTTRSASLSLSFPVISNNSKSLSYLEGLFWVLGCTANAEPRVGLK